MSSKVFSTTRNQEAEERNLSNNELETAAAREKMAEGETSNIDGTENKANKPKLKDPYNPFCEETLAPLSAGNHYSVRKTAAQAILDTALMMANFAQLNTARQEEHVRFRAAAMALISCSLFLQFIFVVLIMSVWLRETEREQKAEYLKYLRKLQEERCGTDTDVKMAISDELSIHMSNRRYRLTLLIINASVVVTFAIAIINLTIACVGIDL